MAQLNAGLKKLALSAAIASVVSTSQSSRAANIDHVVKDGPNGNVTSSGTYSSGGVPSNSPGDLISYNSSSSSSATVDVNGPITIGVIRKTGTSPFSITNVNGNTLTLDGTGLTAANQLFGNAGVAAIANSNTGSLAVGSNISIGATALDIGTTAGNTSVGGNIVATAAESLNFRNNASSAITILDSGDIGASGSSIALSNLGTSAGSTTLNGNLGASVTSITEKSSIASNALILTAANSAFTGSTMIGTADSAATGGTITVSGVNGSIAKSSSYTVVGTGSLLNLDYTGASGAATTDRLGNSTAVSLSLGGELFLKANATAATATTENIGTLTLGAGSGTVTLSEGNTGTETLTSAGFARGSNFATALIRGTSIGSGSSSNTSVKFASTAGLVQVGSSTSTSGGTSGASKTLTIVPYLLGSTSATGAASSFLTYDTTSGLRTLGANETSLISSGGTGENVRSVVSANTVNGAKTFNSVLLGSGATAATTVTGNGAALNVTSGAVANVATTATGSASVSGFSSIIFGTTGANEAIITNANTSVGGDLTVASAVDTFAAGGGLTKAGAGNVILSAGNLYTGATTINQGTVTISGSLAGGSGAVTINNGATLSLAQASNSVFANDIVENGTLAITNAGTQTLSGNVSGSGAVTQATASTALILSGNNSFAGATNVTAGTLNIQNSTGLGSTATGTTVSNGATLQLQGGISVGAEALSLNGGGASGQTGALVNVGGINSFGGLVTLAGSSTISSDAGSLNLTNSGTISGGNKDLTLAGAGNGSLSSIIGTTTGKLIKAGAGTWTVAGVNTYTGTTTVNAGNLSVTGSIAAGSAVTVGGAAATSGLAPTLSGTGTVSGTVSIASAGGGAAGTISAGVGNATGTLSTGALTFGSGATWNVNIAAPGTANTTASAGTSNMLAITGNLANSAGELMTVGAAATGTPGAGTYRIATYTGTDSGLSSVAVAAYGAGAAQLHGKLIDGGAGTGSGNGVFLDEYRLGAANTLGDVSFGSYHVGAALSRNVVLTNTAASDGFSEKLSAANSATGMATVSPSTVTQLTAQTSSNITVGLSNSAGMQSGTVLVAVSSDGAGTSGAGTTALNGQTINVSGTGYNLAAANALATPVNLGIIHVNQSFGSSGVAINNAGPAGSYTEGLDATIGTTSGSATGSGSIADLRPAGGTDASGIAVSLGGSTAVAGTRTGTVAVNFASDGTLSGLASTSLAAQTITVNGQVNDYAAPSFTKTGGSGTVTSTSANSATVDFGSVNQNSGTYTVSVALLNSLISAYEDSLGGAFDTSGVTHFAVNGFAPLSSGGIAAGSSQAGYTIALGTGTVGSFSDRLIFNGTSINSSSTSALSPFTLTLNGAVVAIPEPAALALLGLAGYGTLRRRSRRTTELLTLP